MIPITQKMGKQTGATLITALMMLLVMTLIGISAVKMTSIGILIAGNDQQRLLLMQETESDLINLATPAKLIDPLIKEPVDGEIAEFNADHEYRVLDPRNSYAKEIITDMESQYLCLGFSGNAISMGDNKCRLYDFRVEAKREFGSTKEVRRRGAGKEVPNVCKNSLLCE